MNMATDIFIPFSSSHAQKSYWKLLKTFVTNTTKCQNHQKVFEKRKDSRAYVSFFNIARDSSNWHWHKLISPRYEKHLKAHWDWTVDIYLSLQSMMLSEKANPKRLHCMISFCNIFVEYLFILAVMGLSWSIHDL